MLEIRNLQAGYPGIEVLHDISFTAQAGQITAILGPNGCGKSTLLKAVGGILPPNSGSIMLDGEALQALPQNRIAQKISYLPQNRQVPDITVGRLVLHGRFPYLRYPRRYRQEDYRIAEKAMEDLRILDLADRPMNRLSGGQQQKAYIAIAIAQDTDVILMDEPTTYLDVAHQLQVLQLARGLADAGKHVIMVIHDLSHALENADQVVLLQSGRIVGQGTPEEVYGCGMLEAVFGVQIHRFQSEGRWHYYCAKSYFMQNFANS